MRRAIQTVAGELMITVGVLLLLFVGWQLWWTDVESDSVQSDIVAAITKDWDAADKTHLTQPLRPNGVPVRLGDGGSFALIRVPRFGSDYVRPIIEGTDFDSLKRGVGHYTDSVAPGRVGNFAMAGHRTTYGKPFSTIETLVKGDIIVIETKEGWNVYAVASHEIVEPTAWRVVAPVPDRPGVKPTERWLTMTSCHPRYSAAQRYVVHAKFVRAFTRAQGLPPEYLAEPPTQGG